MAPPTREERTAVCLFVVLLPNYSYNFMNHHLLYKSFSIKFQKNNQGKQAYLTVNRLTC